MCVILSELGIASFSFVSILVPKSSLFSMSLLPLNAILPNIFTSVIVFLVLFNTIFSIDNSSFSSLILILSVSISSVDEVNTLSPSYPWIFCTLYTISVAA